jgi:hypothetical protein
MFKIVVSWYKIKNNECFNDAQKRILCTLPTLLFRVISFQNTSSNLVKICPAASCDVLTNKHINRKYFKLYTNMGYKQITKEY